MRCTVSWVMAYNAFLMLFTCLVDNKIGSLKSLRNEKLIFALLYIFSEEHIDAQGSNVWSGQVTRVIWHEECILLCSMWELLSVLVTFSPPVRRVNDLQEQVDFPAGYVYCQAKHTGKVYLTDEAIKGKMIHCVNFNFLSRI